MQELPQDILGRVFFFLSPRDLLSFSVLNHFLGKLIFDIDSTHQIWENYLDSQKKKFFTHSYKLTFLRRPEYRKTDCIYMDKKGENYLKQSNALIEKLKPVASDKIFSRTKIKNIVLDYIKALKNSNDKLECICAVLFYDNDKFKKIWDKDLLLNFIEIDSRSVSILLDYSETDPPEYVKYIDNKVLEEMKKNEKNMDDLLANKPVLLQNAAFQQTPAFLKKF